MPFANYMDKKTDHIKLAQEIFLANEGEDFTIEEIRKAIYDMRLQITYWNNEKQPAIRRIGSVIVIYFGSEFIHSKDHYGHHYSTITFDNRFLAGEEMPEILKNPQKYIEEH